MEKGEETFCLNKMSPRFSLEFSHKGTFGLFKRKPREMPLFLKAECPLPFCPLEAEFWMFGCFCSLSFIYINLSFFSRISVFCTCSVFCPTLPCVLLIFEMGKSVIDVFKSCRNTTESPVRAKADTGLV